MFEKLVVEQHDAVLVVKLSDPTVRNALTGVIRKEFETVFDDFAQREDTKCLLVTGSEGFFSAGGDIRSFTQPATMVSNRARLTNAHRMLTKMLRLEKPVVMAVNGAAAGAGFGLAMLGDITVAAESAFFQPAFSGIGLAPDFGVATTLPRAVGEKRAKDILLTNARVSAAEAYAMGMVSRIYPDAELFEKALGIARNLSTGATYAHGLTKKLIEIGQQSSLDEFLAAEASFQVLAMASEDHQEGVKAFLEKRRPVFKGA